MVSAHVSPRQPTLVRVTVLVRAIMLACVMVLLRAIMLARVMVLVRRRPPAILLVFVHIFGQESTGLLILRRTLHSTALSLYCDPPSLLLPHNSLELGSSTAVGLRERGSNPSSKRQGLPPSIRRNLKKDSKKASHWQLVLDRPSVKSPCYEEVQWNKTLDFRF